MKKAAFITAVFLMYVSTVPAQQNQPLKATPKDVIAQFMDKSFGMFIHFGPFTGNIISLSGGAELEYRRFD